jgi:hypothetical protein
MPLSPQLCAFFALAVGSTVSDLLDQLDNQYDPRWDGLLQTEEGRAAARQSLVNFPDYVLEISQQTTPTTRLYNVTLPGHVHPALVGLIGLAQAAALPTALENLVFWGLIDGNLPWHNDMFQPGAALVPWRQAMSRVALVGCPRAIPHQNQLRRVLAALFALTHVDLPKARMSGSVLSTVNDLSAVLEDSGTSVTKVRLLSDAIAEVNPKWRFLSFYRIVEHAYLSNIKKILVKEFERDAKGAVKRAADSLSSEPNQLVTLTESINLRAEFAAFSAEVDALLALGNQFMSQVDDGARGESLYGAHDQYKKGIIRFYKLRCSIAHGGTSSVIFEEFSDADDAAIYLMKKVETIALNSMGIRLL